MNRKVTVYNFGTEGYRHSYPCSVWHLLSLYDTVILVVIVSWTSRAFARFGCFSRLVVILPQLFCELNLTAVVCAGNGRGQHKLATRHRTRTAKKIPPRTSCHFET